MSKLNTWEFCDGWTKNVDGKYRFNPNHIGWIAYIEDSLDNTQNFNEWASQNLLGEQIRYVPSVENNKEYIKLHLRDKNDAKQLANYFGLSFD